MSAPLVALLLFVALAAVWVLLEAIGALAHTRKCAGCTGCTGNCNEGRSCACRTPAPDYLSAAVAAHVWEATPGLHFNDTPAARDVLGMRDWLSNMRTSWGARAIVARHHGVHWWRSRA